MLNVRVHPPDRRLAWRPAAAALHRAVQLRPASCCHQVDRPGHPIAGWLK
jgi:hypothetical protein